MKLIKAVRSFIVLASEERKALETFSFCHLVIKFERWREIKKERKKERKKKERQREGERRKERNKRTREWENERKRKREKELNE